VLGGEYQSRGRGIRFLALCRFSFQRRSRGWVGRDVWLLLLSSRRSAWRGWSWCRLEAWFCKMTPRAQRRMTVINKERSTGHVAVGRTFKRSETPSPYGSRAENWRSDRHSVRASTTAFSLITWHCMPVSMLLTADKAHGNHF
jgi:hypothetical protein